MSAKRKRATMPASKPKHAKCVRCKPKACSDCRDHALKALAWACAMEKLETALEQETARMLSVAGENERLFDRFWELYDIKEAQFAEDIRAMLDVLAKALERANIEIARKESAIESYKNAWSKGQSEPYINGRCA